MGRLILSFRRVVALAWVALAWLVLPAQAISAPLCEALDIPAELGLVCAPVPGPANAVAIQPASGEFAALSRMTVRELPHDRADAVAWTDPEAWLKRQLTLGSDLPTTLSELGQSPDSPVANGTGEALVARALELLQRLQRLPLTACDDPLERGAGRWELRCRFTNASTGLFVVERLVASGERRYGIELRTMNEQRLRHFEAIANSFAPAAS